MLFDHQPRVLELEQGDNSAGKTLILAQAYMRAYGDWVQLLVSAVDSKRTQSALQMRPTINLLVPATLRAGRVYQLHVQENVDVHGKNSVRVWLEDLGTTEQYEALLKRHPETKRGTPLSAADLASS